ncbi:unnamed protein product [Brassicogethes aeneus]|uniref:Uncharacterized protein n=1 Tax=Brassicogethes aeneus TaxID=1431903 RepID=A0A9P0B2B3_BRAAE|nr:unnamed protein product [Brassicogethes aeneus]
MEGKTSTEWALLFPLKAGLFSMKSSTVTRSAERIKKKPAKNTNHVRLVMRRGSSMSDLDKVAANALPDLVRSTTANQHLSASPASVPHSPYLSRSYMSSRTVSVQGSIGDLMNQKKYGSSQWSIRSETLIARTVPLSTVTPRHSPPPCSEDGMFEDEFDDVSGPLTVAQRTQRLSRLIKQQRSSLSRRHYLYLPNVLFELCVLNL